MLVLLIVAASVAYILIGNVALIVHHVVLDSLDDWWETLRAHLSVEYEEASGVAFALVMWPTFVLVDLFVILSWPTRWWVDRRMEWYRERERRRS